MIYIKQILCVTANPELQCFRCLCFACLFLCAVLFASPVHGQSEFIFRGQNAVSVGGGLSRTLKDASIYGGNRSLALVVSPEGALDVGWTFSKNSRFSKVVTTFFVGVNLGKSIRKFQRSGVILFGAVTENSGYVFGTQLYHRENTSKSFFLVPQAQGGVISFSSGRFTRDTKLFWDIGLSLGFGTSKSPLVVLTPSVSKLEDFPVRIGVSALLVVLFPNKSLKKKR